MSYVINIKFVYLGITNFLFRRCHRLFFSVPNIYNIFLLVADKHTTKLMTLQQRQQQQQQRQQQQYCNQNGETASFSFRDEFGSDVNLKVRPLKKCLMFQMWYSVIRSICLFLIRKFSQVKGGDQGWIATRCLKLYALTHVYCCLRVDTFQSS